MSAKNLHTGGDSGILYTDRRDFYIDPQVVKELWTDVAPFTTVISNRETRATNDPLFKMFEHRNPWVKQEFSINKGTPGTVSNNDTGLGSLPVDGVVGLSAVGASMVLGGVAELLAPPNPTPEAEQTPESSAFSSPLNVSMPGVAVPLVYGTAICGSIVINTSLEIGEVEA